MKYVFALVLVLSSLSPAMAQDVWFGHPNGKCVQDNPAQEYLNKGYECMKTIKEDGMNQECSNSVKNFGYSWKRRIMRALTYMHLKESYFYAKLSDEVMTKSEVDTSVTVIPVFNSKIQCENAQVAVKGGGQ
jgi:hypothetical protein